MIMAKGKLKYLEWMIFVQRATFWSAIACVETSMERPTINGSWHDTRF